MLDFIYILKLVDGIKTLFKINNMGLDLYAECERAKKEDEINSVLENSCFIKIPIYWIEKDNKRVFDVESIQEEFNSYLEEMERRNEL